MEEFDAIIVGAGAAGLMCAIRAGQRGRRVLLLDHAEKVGAKILISGGGRCNFTNIKASPERFISDNQHFAKSALTRYTQSDFIALVEKHNIPYHEKTLGQLFCDGSARAIITMLLSECEATGVDIRCSHKINDIKKNTEFEVDTDKGSFKAPSVVLATGGLSIPKMGATDFTHLMAKRFGLDLTDIRPGLVPLKLEAKDLLETEALSGVALEVIASFKKNSFRENMLFTHRGLSGPAILQISSYWREGNAISLNLLPDIKMEDYLISHKKSRAKSQLKTILGEVLPQRLASLIADKVAPDQPIADLTDMILKKIAATINDWQLKPVGSEGYAKAEVTVGGVSTNSLSSKTMGARDVPGLFIIGEAVDVTGWLGGYNFQWAWSSGFCAGESL